MGNRFKIDRFIFVYVGIFVVYAALVFRLYDLQVVKSDHYLALAGNAGDSDFLNLPPRGAIYFTGREGDKLPAVVNKEFKRIYAVPAQIEDASEAAHLVGGIFNLDPEKLTKRFLNKKSQFELLSRKANSELIEQVEVLKMKGLYVDTMPARFYQFGSVAAQTLGFLRPNEEGHGESGSYGVEEFYNDEVLQKGEDLSLTIDPNIQIEAERILEGVVEKYRAKGGSVIVQDPGSGAILAMGSVPTFDPNSYSEAELSDFMNPTVQRIYEPGSVFKVLTMAAGIDAGKITPQTTFNDPGVLHLNGKKIQNWDLKAHGTVTMTNVIEKSLNTGAAFAARQTGYEKLTEYFHNFGFGAKTKIDLPGELKGDLGRLTPKAPAINFATASFGQGVAVTPLQLVNAVSVIANGGKLMQPHVNGNLGAKVIREVLKPASAKAVTKMMVSAVDKAEVAKIKGYSLAGKTGTAQVPDLKRGGYGDKVTNTYVGFGPASDPKFTILIKLDEPENAPLAGQTVVPAFRDLAQFILNYYHIPPDRLENGQ